MHVPHQRLIVLSCPAARAHRDMGGLERVLRRDGVVVAELWRRAAALGDALRRCGDRRRAAAEAEVAAVRTDRWFGAWRRAVRWPGTRAEEYPLPFLRWFQALLRSFVWDHRTFCFPWMVIGTWHSLLRETSSNFGTELKH